jgi:hypothetical protein
MPSPEDPGWSFASEVNPSEAVHFTSAPSDHDVTESHGWPVSCIRVDQMEPSLG